MMIDVYKYIRETKIYVMQKSLKMLLEVVSSQDIDFCQKAGLSVEDIQNLIEKKESLTPSQYLAICSVVDRCIEQNSNLRNILLEQVLRPNDNENICVFASNLNNTFTENWFSCFAKNPYKIDNSYNGQNKEVFLPLIKYYKIFLDDTIFYSQGFESFVFYVQEFMKQSGAKFIVALKVVETIQSKFNTTEGHKALDLLAFMQKTGIIEIRGEDDSRDVVDTLMSIFLTLKKENMICTLTNNARLIEQVSMLNQVAIGHSIIIANFNLQKGFFLNEVINK